MLASVIALCLIAGRLKSGCEVDFNSVQFIEGETMVCSLKKWMHHKMYSTPANTLHVIKFNCAVAKSAEDEEHTQKVGHLVGWQQNLLVGPLGWHKNATTTQPPHPAKATVTTQICTGLAQ